jgi:cell division protein FtsW
VSRSVVALLLSVSLLFSIGLLMVFNTTSAEIIDRSLDMNVHAALYKQIGYAFVGLFFGMVAYRVGHERLLRWSVPILIGVTVLLLLVFIPGIGQTINGARRWLGIFGFSFQPSECAKVIIPSVFIQWVLKQKGEIPFKPFLRVLLALAIPTVLIFIEPDNGTTAILAAVLSMLFLLTRIRWTYWALPLFALVAVGGVAASYMPHVPDRIRIYLHPELDLRGKGHQPHQAKIAAGSGGLFGRGLGESLQKLNYLPEARSDYIAAIYAEETGFVGIVVLIGLYGCLTYAGCAISLNAATKEGFLLAAMLTFLISIQAFLNLGIVSGLLPSKGMTLPFFSQGGTSLMVNLMAIFLLIDIARKSSEKQTVSGR